MSDIQTLTTMSTSSTSFDNIDTSTLYKTDKALKRLSWLDNELSFYLDNGDIEAFFGALILTDEETAKVVNLLRTFVQTRRDETVAYLQQRTIK